MQKLTNIYKKFSCTLFLKSSDPTLSTSSCDDSCNHSVSAEDWKYCADVLDQLPLNKLNGILKELHGGHYIFILLKHKIDVKICSFINAFSLLMELPFGKFL